MDNKVQELANKIYHEGVEKASSEAEQILNDAKSQKEEILAKAKAEAEKIVADAHKQVQEFKDNSESELKLSSNQAIEALRTEVTNLINSASTQKAMDKVLSDDKAIYNIILKMVEQWSKHQDVTIETSDAEALESYMKAEAKDLLDNNLSIKQVNGKSHTFDITPKDGAYKVSISKEAFVEYFKEFMRPKLRKFLFEN